MISFLLDYKEFVQNTLVNIYAAGVRKLATTKKALILKKEIAVSHVSFLNYHKGYIVKVQEDLTSMENIDSMTKQIVKFCKNSSISLTSLHERIDYHWKDNGKYFIIFYVIKLYIHR